MKIAALSSMAAAAGFRSFVPRPARSARRPGTAPAKKKNKTKLFVVNNSTLEPEGLNQNRQDLEMRTTIARMKPLDEIKVGGNPSATKSVTRWFQRFFISWRHESNTVPGNQDSFSKWTDISYECWKSCSFNFQHNQFKAILGWIPLTTIENIHYRRLIKLQLSVLKYWFNFYVS